MKCVNGMLMLAMVLMGTGIVFADGLPKDSVQNAPNVALVQSGEQLKLIYPGSSPVQLNVKIMDSQGNELLTERLAQPSGFLRPYDFSGLPDGEYTVQVNDDNNVLKRQVMHLSAPASILAHVTRLNGEGDRFILAVPRQGLNSVAVKIYQGDMLLYQKKVNASQGFATVYNVKGLSPTEGLTFEVTSPDHTTATMTK